MIETLLLLSNVGANGHKKPFEHLIRGYYGGIN